MKIRETTILSKTQKSAIIALWNKEYPLQLQYQNEAEFDRYLTSLSDVKHYLLYTEAEVIMGWSITFRRDNEQWFAIIVNTQVQKRGNGSLLLTEIKKRSSALNGWVVDKDNYQKIDGTTYVSHYPFILKMASNYFHPRGPTKLYRQ